MVTADAGRQLVAKRGLTAAAVRALTPLMSGVGFDELGLVKSLLKRFFSDEPWTALDASALSRAVGSTGREGEHEEVMVVHHRLDADLTLVAGWVDGEFVIDVEVGDTERVDVSGSQPSLDLGRTFGHGVEPQPTPNPRTLRFATARRVIPASESYRRGDRFDDGRVAAIFNVDDEVVDVMVAADFVAVSLARPGRWPALLEPVLAVVASGFGGNADDGDDGEEELPADHPSERPEVDARAGGGTRRTAASPGSGRTRLDRAWADIGSLHANDPGELDVVLIAARDPDGARRQVAAQLLADAPREIAAQVWSELLADTSRLVRRAAADAVVDAGHEELRPLLELALTDSDAWVRWKALHGLVLLGPHKSLAAIEALADDPDFRVRLEAANARRALK